MLARSSIASIARIRPSASAAAAAISGASSFSPDEAGFLSSHRLLSTATHLGDGAYGSASGRTLRYRIMYAAEVTLPMLDNGTDGDQVAGDGIFTATIPASAMHPSSCPST